MRYLLHEQPVRFLKGKLRLRQITRLTQGGHQTPIVTSRWDLRAIVLAYRMFERWRQENFFKYVREEYLIDALTDYEIEPDDPNRSVPNPAHKAIEKELRRMRAQLGKLRANYAAITLEARPRRLPRTAAKKAKEKLRTEIAQAKARLEKLQAQHHALPRRVSVAEAQKGQAVGTHRRSAPYHPGPTQFASSIASSRGSLPGPESNPHAVSGNSTRDALRGRSPPSKPKKRTGFRGTMSGALMLRWQPWPLYCISCGSQGSSALPD